MKIGFYLDNKETSLEELAAFNSRLTKASKPCVPWKGNRKTNPAHPDEGNPDLPVELRGKHFDSYKQICIEMGCWRWQDYQNRQSTLSEKGRL